MQQIKDMEFSGERPLFASHDLQLDNVVIHAGESALKECSNIIAIGCRFEGKYPFWHVDGFTIKNSLFTEGGTCCVMVLPKSSDDGYTGWKPQRCFGRWTVSDWKTYNYPMLKKPFGIAGTWN